jgi:4-amino-4-deoxy-L-arabinose transferase-like glycosyltransferase
MSYSGIATAAISLALLAVAVAVVAGVLLCLGRRRLAQRMLPAFLAVLAGAVVLSFAAAAKSRSDLQAHSQRTLSLASAAERAARARFGRYTTNVVRLERLNRAFATDVNVNEPIVRLTRGPGPGNITVWVSLGPGTHAQATLRRDAR